MICRSSDDEKESNAGGAHDNPQPRQREHDAVQKQAGRPGSISHVAGMSGGSDGGGKDPESGDTGSAADKSDTAGEA